MKVEITKAQLEAIIHLKDDVEAMIGCGDEEGADTGWNESVNHIKSFLKNNRIKIKKTKTIINTQKR